MQWGSSYILWILKTKTNLDSIYLYEASWLGVARIPANEATHRDEPALCILIILVVTVEKAIPKPKVLPTNLAHHLDLNGYFPKIGVRFPHQIIH